MEAACDGEGRQHLVLCDHTFFEPLTSHVARQRLNQRRQRKALPRDCRRLKEEWTAEPNSGFRHGDWVPRGRARAVGSDKEIKRLLPSNGGALSQGVLRVCRSLWLRDVLRLAPHQHAISACVSTFDDRDKM